MIKIKALNEDVSTSDSECEEPENGLLTREAQEEHLQSLYCQALKLVDSDKEQAKLEFISLLEYLEELDDSCGLTNIVNLKYLSLKNLGLISPDNLDYFLDALAIDGNDVTLWIETGRRALNQFINLPLARACFEEASRLSSFNWVVVDTLMSLYFVLNDYDNCLKLCVKALNKDQSYFKARLLISEMLKRFPPISSEIPVNLSYLHKWSPAQKDMEKKERILSEFDRLKQQRKRKFIEDEENQKVWRKRFSLNLESSALNSLQSLTKTLKKILLVIEKENCPRSTIVSIEFEPVFDEAPSADENISDEYLDKEKATSKPEKRGSFPFEFIDKRRSTRVQKIQNKTGDSCEFSSDNIYEKILNMIPKTILNFEIQVKKLEMEIPDYDDSQVENLILSKFTSKQKDCQSDGKRIDQLINDLLYAIADQATFIKLPSDFIELYRVHRQINSLPFPLTCQMGRDITLNEIRLIIAANEMEFQQSEAIFLTQMLPHLQKSLTPSEYDHFFVRLLTLRGSKESQVDYLLMANEILISNNIKLIQAANQVVYNSSSLKSMINTLNENNLDKLLDQERHEELIELLSSKPDLTDAEEEYLCQSIKSSQQWKRGVEVIAASKQLTDRFLKLLRICLKSGTDVSIDRDLTIKLLKLGTEKYNALAWVCILQTFINESPVADEKMIVNLINTVHQYLGRRGACTKSNGEFLILSLDFAINQCSKTKDDLILQCFACLYNHPPPRPGCTFLQAHPGCSQVPLLWEQVDILYSYFIPEDLPEFDSVKRVSIDSDTEILLCRILPLIPEHLNPEKDAKLISDYLKHGKTMTHQPTTPRHHVTQHLYYFLADYYFKNKEFQKAKHFYILDLALNRDRFDSWAACALSITHLIEQYFSNGGDIFYTSTEKVIRLVESSFRCYVEALRLEPNNTKIWIEYGNLAYGVASYISRVRKTRPNIEGSEKDKFIKQQKRMLYRARICFESANNVAGADEIWLHYYFLGKIAERSNILQALKYYELSDLHLALNGATYPRKISYHNPTRLSIEALEIHYRIHACVLKYIRRHSNKLSPKILTSIKIHLLRALRSPFVKQMQVFSSNSSSDHDYTSNESSRPNLPASTNSEITDDVKEVVSDLVTLVEDGVLDGDERQLRPSIMEMCLEAMNRSLLRFPNHYKSLYRMAHHFCSLKDFLAARVVLLGRFTTSSGSQSLLKKPDFPEELTNGNNNNNNGSNNGQESSKSEPILGLFGEHKNNNLFNGIWRIPIDDIDRPGSFSTHMYRSTQLLIKVSWALSDLHRLSTIAIQLSKTPEAGKKYLRDIDRQHLAKDALRRCFSILRNRIEEAKQNHSQLDQIKNDLRKVSEKLVRSSVYQRETLVFVGECEKLIRNIQ